ncbi:MAG: hypothetical protein IH605_00865 [Burkholderiales bacterium]|nr:hypothetical protein [Burkholderiales bacterium]
MHTTHIDSDIFSRVNDLPMCKSERQRVSAYIHDGEVIGELLCDAFTGLAHAGHGISRLAHDVKAVFAKPARH